MEQEIRTSALVRSSIGKEHIATRKKKKMERRNSSTLAIPPFHPLSYITETLSNSFNENKDTIFYFTRRTVL